ncbi:nucleotide-binding universal stress UspA family protein [Altererythrobacter atlanticus]|uniref:Universal stress protein family protein n=1 Tax=Croceibacterium atlanticum TaxID=1267766 RepID=A0A0F7KRF2_9SPHN|nr:universal stress protein [Croceibacterium atlanticum]AKH42174.1 Universal stress protein family protein [Croceibacterium atlanticum]MBB5734013.1 nucleotide-binding universal stress UspA family protein [Croceibacterium atlanticum]
MIRSIALSTDFSDAGRIAFIHALRLAVEFKARLDLIHVRDPHDRADWDKFPHVRETLQAWGMLPPGASVSQIAGSLGVTVRKVEINDADAADGLTKYLAEHRPELLVMASHGRVGLNRWLAGSVSAEVAMATDIPTLLFGPEARGFVDADTGAIGLSTATIPVDHEPSPIRALQILQEFFRGFQVDISALHAGRPGPELGDAIPVRLVGGDAVDAILAESARVDLLVMPTAGRHGFMDMIRGSTTELVLHEAACPILAVPAE